MHTSQRRTVTCRTSRLAGTGVNPAFLTLGLLLVLMPIPGLLARDIALGIDAVALYIDYQTGIQRPLLFLAGWIFLFRKIPPDGLPKNPNEKGAFHPDHMMNRLFSSWLLLMLTQVLLTLYAIALWILPYRIEPTTAINPAAIDWGFLLHQSWHQGLSIVLLITLGHTLWMVLNNRFLATFVSSGIWVAGLSKPAWLHFFQQTETLAWVTRPTGWLLRMLIPSFHSHDLWIMREAYGLAGECTYSLIVSIQTTTLILILTFASWRAVGIKST